KRLAALSPAPKSGAGIKLDELRPEVSATHIRYRFVEVEFDRAHRTATLTVRGPDAEVKGVDAIVAAGASWWPLRAFRELDDALLRLRFNHEEYGLLLLKTRGAAGLVLSV